MLLAEDEVVTSLYLKMELTRIGCEVVRTVSRGEDAVAAADLFETGLLLMDINLAGKMDGIEAVRIIREKKDTPVIFITGYSDNIIEERASGLNPVALMLKPLNYKELVTIIKKFFY